MVELREITAETVRRVTDLQVSALQSRFVASNAVSLAEALFHREAWYRAIYDGGEPVGFVMLYDESQRAGPPAEPKLFVWRFMIAEPFQGRGIGAAALDRVVAHARDRGFRELSVSCVPGDGSPQSFYERFGFVPTGAIEDGEVVLTRSLHTSL
jgi:diamine N-acetyltransferase